MKKLIKKTVAISFSVLSLSALTAQADMLSIDQINKIYGGSAKSDQLKSEFTLRQWIESKGLRDRVIQDSKHEAEDFFVRGDNTHNEKIAKYLTFNELRSFVKDQNDHVCKGLGLREGSVEAALATPELNALKAQTYERLGEEKIADFLQALQQTKQLSVPESEAKALIHRLYPTSAQELVENTQVYVWRDDRAPKMREHSYQTWNLGRDPLTITQFEILMEPGEIQEFANKAIAHARPVDAVWPPYRVTFRSDVFRARCFLKEYTAHSTVRKERDSQFTTIDLDFPLTNGNQVFRILSDFKATHLKYRALDPSLDLTPEKRIGFLMELGYGRVQAEAAVIRTLEKNHGEDLLIHDRYETRFPPLYCKGTMAQVIQHYHASDDFQVKLSQGDPNACRAYKITLLQEQSSLLQKQTEAICQIRDRVLGDGGGSGAGSGERSVDPACAALLAEVLGSGTH